MIEILPGVFVTPAKAVEIHASLGRVINEHLDPTPRADSTARVPAQRLTIIDDILWIWPTGESKVSSAVLAEMLSNEIPDRYAGLRGSDLSRELRPHRRQVWIQGRNVKGFWLKDLEAASWSRPS